MSDPKQADEDSGLEDQLESENEADDPVELPTGGIMTTDPSFKGGAMQQPARSYPPVVDDEESK